MKIVFMVIALLQKKTPDTAETNVNLELLFNALIVDNKLITNIIDN